MDINFVMTNTQWEIQETTLVISAAISQVCTDSVSLLMEINSAHFSLCCGKLSLKSLHHIHLFVNKLYSIQPSGTFNTAVAIISK